MLDVLRDPPSKRHPAGEDAYQREIIERSCIAFEDLVRDAPQGTVQSVFGEDFGEGLAFGAAVPTGVGP